MEFTCKSNEFKEMIQIVEKAVSQKSSVAVLENIYLELTEQKLIFRGNNLEMGIENILPIDNVVSSGNILVKAKTLSSIVSKIDNEHIHIRVDENNKFFIKSGAIDMEINSCSVEDYPVFPTVDAGVKFSIKSNDLIDLIKYTIISVSYDATKQFLNGILIKSEGDQLYFVATDGYRLALKKQTILPLEQSVNSIIPYKSLLELLKIFQGLSEECSVDVIISDGQVSFKINDFILISRLIQGQFPDFNQVIPQNSSHIYKIKKDDLLAATERASIIASASNNVLRLLFDETQLSKHANAKGLGEFKEDVVIERLKGDSQIKIAFNVRLVLDVLKVVSTDYITVHLNNELSPCRIMEDGNENFSYIIMPVRTADYQS